MGAYDRTQHSALMDGTPECKPSRHSGQQFFALSLGFSGPQPTLNGILPLCAAFWGLFNARESLLP